MENARAYLIQYADGKNCDKWVRNVIYAFLQAEGNVSAEVKNLLAEELLGDISDMEAPSVKTKMLETDSQISLIELKHISGVGALEQNQTIKFGKDINIIYGLNGSGKSSYFRILQAIADKTNARNVIGNIYIDEQTEPEAVLKYQYNGHVKELSWNDIETLASELSSIRVFDTSYTKGLLRKRSSDELLVKPFQLALFSDVINLIDELIKVASIEISECENKLPIIDEQFLDDEVKSILKKDVISETDKNCIYDLSVFGEAEKQRIDELQAEIELLNKANVSDQIKLETEHKSALESARIAFRNLIVTVNDLFTRVNNQIEVLIEAKTASEEARLGYDKLNDFPGINSDSWKRFVNAGQDYINEHEVDVCPYCRRPYDESSLEIVKSYAAFLADENEVNYKKQIKVTNELRNEVIKMHVPAVQEYQFEFVSESLNSIFAETITSLENRKKELIELMDSLVVGNINFVSADILWKNIDEFVTNIEDKIGGLSADQKEKDSKKNTLAEELKILLKKQSLHEQKTALQTLFDTKSDIAYKKERVSKVNTKKLSNLSKKAHDELLTTRLEALFSTFLNELNVRDVRIELKSQNNKGVQQTELLLRGKNNVESILSEGEQKATALALFLAEIIISNNHSVLIFDDPVNSMDHRMMGAFAEKLLNISNQIVVFTHNRMFLESFGESKNGHFCKTYDSACNKNKGRHILLYETLSEGQNSKGVICKKQIDKAATHLQAVEELLKESPFTKKQEACSKLRFAVELLIDEVIFNGQVPTKYSTKSSRINWDGLKNISSDSSIIDSLKEVHGRCSGGELHNGLERNENPVEKADVQEMLKTLKTICG